MVVVEVALTETEIITEVVINYKIKNPAFAGFFIPVFQVFCISLDKLLHNHFLIQ